jgi:hypothetical protein
LLVWRERFGCGVEVAGGLAIVQARKRNLAALRSGLRLGQSQPVARRLLQVLDADKEAVGTRKFAGLDRFVGLVLEGGYLRVVVRFPSTGCAQQSVIFRDLDQRRGKPLGRNVLFSSRNQRRADLARVEIELLVEQVNRSLVCRHDLLQVLRSVADERFQLLRRHPNVAAAAKVDRDAALGLVDDRAAGRLRPHILRGRRRRRTGRLILAEAANRSSC